MTSGIPLDGSRNSSWFAIDHAVPIKWKEKIGNSPYHKSKRSELSNTRRSIALKGKKKLPEHIAKLSGPNHWNWQGGISGLPENSRQTAEYDEWRLAVYKKDHYTCQDCGHRFNGIVAHHIKSFAGFPELRYNVENGITLCRSCHLKRHSEIGYATKFKKV